MSNQQHCGFNYWMNRLIDAGRIRSPGRYTDQHIRRLYREWRDKPLTDLHQRVLKFEKEVKQRLPASTEENV